MSTPIEDYAIIGDTRTVAAVARNGSIDWWCVPRIDSGAVFAALLGDPKHGRWSIAPKGEVTATRRAYAGDSLVLETEFETAERHGQGHRLHVARRRPSDDLPHRRGRVGRGAMQLELIARFDYGSIAPWAQIDRRRSDARRGERRAPLPQPGAARRPRPRRRRADFTVREGDRRRVLARVVLGAGGSAAAARRVGRAAARPSSTGPSGSSAARTRASGATTSFGRSSPSRRCSTRRRARCAPPRRRRCRSSSAASATGTTGSRGCGTPRSHSRRCCMSGYTEEASAWQHWLQRAVAGDPGEFQIMYGVGGERRLTEVELDWLPGLRGLEAGAHRQRRERAVPARRVR